MPLGLLSYANILLVHFFITGSTCNARALTLHLMSFDLPGGKGRLPASQPSMSQLPRAVLFKLGYAYPPPPRWVREDMLHE
jgi:hypothetical protein